MLKSILILCAMLIAGQASSEELEYTRETAVDYLSSRADVYVIMKAGGRLSYSEYNEYLGNSNADESSYEMWKNIRFGEKEKFLIIKNYKGSEKVGSIINTNQLSDYSFTRVGEKYLAFLHKSNETTDFEFGPCDVFSLESIPGDLMDDFGKLVLFLGGSTLTPCLYHVEYD